MKLKNLTTPKLEDTEQAELSYIADENVKMANCFIFFSIYFWQTALDYLEFLKQLNCQ